MSEKGSSALWRMTFWFLSLLLTEGNVKDIGMGKVKNSKSERNVQVKKMANYTKYNRGSEWQKWDLHIHTPISIYQKYGGEANWDKFIDALERLPSDVKVIGITDYYFIDGYEKVMQYKANGRLCNLDKIFPILEFRIDTFGSGHENNLQKINLHILFDIDEIDLSKEIDKVKKEFISQIPITKLDKHKTKMLSIENLTSLGDNDLQKGFSNLIPSTEKVFELINSVTWKDKTFLFLGYKEWSNLEKNNQLKPLKEDLYDRVFAFFTSNYDTLEKSQLWLNEYGVKRLLHSIDVHNFTFLDTANKDKKGEYIESIKYSCNTWIKADPTFEGLKQIIYEPDLRVRIQPNLPEDKAGYQVVDRIEICSDHIFNKDLALNPNLNSIIGGRSTGKSILLAAIAKKLKTEKPVNFELKPDYDKFVDEISNLLKIFWKDGEENYQREIEYFKQGYMYELARKEGELNELIQDILCQKGKETYLNDYNKFVSENKKRISDLISDFFRILTDIKDKEQKSRDKGDKKGIEDEITRLTNDLNKLNITTISAEEKATYERHKEIIEKANQNKTTTQNDILKIEALKRISLFKENISYELTSISDNRKKAVEALFVSLKTDFEQKWIAMLDTIIAEAKINEDVVNQEIRSSSEDITYEKVSTAFKESTQLTECEEKIKLQKDKLFNINKLLAEIEALKIQKNEIKKNIIDAHKQFFEQINKELPNLSDSKDGLEIKAKAKFKLSNYRDMLCSGLHQQSQINQNISNFQYLDNPSYDAHFTDLFEKLINDQLTLKGGYTSQSLVNSILAESFYSLNYDIEYEGDDFKKMSDGKKAFVVLKLLLDFSNKNCPILIDQPEDDLDNRSIYLDLVQYLRKKKESRQIILVTHNPNVVVGADSELVIVANQNGLKNFNRDEKKFQYVAGSLEHTFSKKVDIPEVLESQGIREHVCEILEGGNEAFKMRESKYGI